MCFSRKGKHHTSICDKKANALFTTNSNTVTYPVIIVSVEGVKCHAVIGTGAGASYVSSKFISLINKKPAQTETKTIQTLLNTSRKKIPIYSVQISDTKHQFSFQTELHKLEKSVLVELPNPKYLELQNKYQHLKDLEVNDSDPKAVLPVHVILGVNDYTKIKTQERPRVGLEGEPVAELNYDEWLFRQEATVKLLIYCFLKHLCVIMKTCAAWKNHVKSDDLVYDKFRKQLGHDSEGYYETNLM